MNIHVCRRCEGCGHVTGGYKWEIPWTRWARDNQDTEPGVLRPHACPDCGGTGALLDIAVGELNGLPSRRGIQSNRYAHHVSVLLQTKGSLEKIG